jgi:hypothetical protein
MFDKKTYNKKYRTTHKSYFKKYEISPKRKQYLKKYRKKNRHRILKQNREYLEKNRAIINLKKRIWYSKNKHKSSEYYSKNRTSILRKSKIHQKKNKIVIREKKRIYKNNREKYDIYFKIINRLRHRVYCVCKTKNARKNFKFKEYLGCSVAYFISYIEAQFQMGMNWDNYGNGENNWSFDHIRPCASFDINIPKNQLICFHFLNQRPLWHKENVLKGNRYNDIDKKIWVKKEKIIKKLQNMNSVDRDAELNGILININKKY